MEEVKSESAKSVKGGLKRIGFYIFCTLLLLLVLGVLSISSQRTLLEYTESQLNKIKNKSGKTEALNLSNILTPSTMNVYKTSAQYKNYTTNQIKRDLILEDKVNSIPRLDKLVKNYEERYGSNRQELVKMYDNTMDSVHNQYLIKKKLQKYENEKAHYYDPQKSNVLIR